MGLAATGGAAQGTILTFTTTISSGAVQGTAGPAGLDGSVYNVSAGAATGDISNDAGNANGGYTGISERRI